MKQHVNNIETAEDVSTVRGNLDRRGIFFFVRSRFYLLIDVIENTASKQADPYHDQRRSVKRKIGVTSNPFKDHAVDKRTNGVRTHADTDYT